MTFWSDVLSSINESGWAKSHKDLEQGKQCVVTAFYYVVGFNAKREYAKRRIEELEEGLNCSWLKIPYWNDDPYTIWADVESLLKELHERELEKGEV